MSILFAILAFLRIRRNREVTKPPESAPPTDENIQRITPEKLKEFDYRNDMLERFHRLRATLCRVNCKPTLHRPACKAMKKDIERLKEIIL